MKENSETSDIVLRALKKNNISINSKRFISQLKIHPEYPQLISVADTLEAFGINFEAYETCLEDIDPHIDSFLALLENESNQAFLSLIEHKNKKYKANSINISENHLKSLWKGIIIVTERKKMPLVKIVKPIFFYSAIAFVLLLSFIKLSIFDFLFLLLNATGVFLSVVALSIQLNLNSSLARKVCYSSKQNNCESVINSKKWRIFELINVTDLGFTFFLSQAVLFSVSMIYDLNISFYLFQHLLLASSFPLLFLSLYYQKFIVKKWCVVCLGIIVVIATEFLLLFFLNRTPVYNWNHLIPFASFFILFFALWKLYKAIILKNKLLTESKIKHERFFNNYTVFKALLTNGHKLEYKSDFLFFSKSNTKLTFTLVTDPFCNHCKYFDYQLNLLLKDVDIDSFSLNTVFNIDIEEEQGKDKVLYSTMVSLQRQKGNMFFFHDLKEWFAHEDIDKWLLKRNISETENTQANHILSKQEEWCKLNGINYTPALFINGYKLPDIYNVENLQYFIDDLIEDTF